MIPTPSDPDARKVIAWDAERLRQDPAFQRGMQYLHNIAVHKLAEVEPTNADAIREAQAFMRVVGTLAMSIAIAAKAAEQDVAYGGDEQAANQTFGTA